MFLYIAASDSKVNVSVKVTSNNSNVTRSTKPVSPAVSVPAAVNVTPRNRSVEETDDDEADNR